MADSSKTEQATPRQRQKARETGPGHALARAERCACRCLPSQALCCSWAARRVPHWTHFFRTTLDLASTDSIEPNGPLLFWTSVEAMRWVFPIVLAGLVVSLFAGLAQGGFVFAPEALAFKFERLSPAGPAAADVFSRRV